jgi:hypothetical protein
MLAKELKPIGFDTWEKEPWESYCSRLALPDSEGARQFFRQIPYDHFDHFNERYPDFEIGEYDLSIVRLTADEAAAKIRFFGNREMRMWCWQYDEFERKNQNYPVFRFMAKNGTYSFPPVVIDPKNLRHDSYVYGKPLHLIEGTHRLSYLIRMLERGLILPESVHNFVFVTPK